MSIVRWHTFGAASLLMLLLVALLSACSPHSAVFVDEGNSYDSEQVAGLQSTVEKPSSAGSPVEEASELRRGALIELRKQGEEGAALAEFVTRTLPDNGRSVPYYGEAALVDGTEAWVLLEMWGSEGGILDHSRVWVFDRETGDILYSTSQ